MTKEEWLRFVDKIIQEDSREVVGVQAKMKKFVFAPLESSADLRLDYDVAVLPPKKYLLPQHEDLMRFSLKGGAEADMSPASGRIIFGVHPYDVIAIQQMDKVYLGKNPDDAYKKRRNETVLVASDILSVQERAFSASMGTNTVKEGYDLLVTDLKDRVLLEIGSEKGKILLEKYGKNIVDGENSDAEAANALRKEIASSFKTETIHGDDWHGLLEKEYGHPVWQEESEKCLECGSCTLVCPTCYCYDVQDIADLDMKEGARKRTWDGCLLKAFTAVGSGEVFRDKKKDRYRHRFYRKGKYNPDRYGFTACVGCGRCSTACLPDIADPANVFTRLASADEEGEPETNIDLTPPKVQEAEIDKPVLMPRSATIVRIEEPTKCEKLYELKMDDGKPLDYKPGQFVMVSVFGIGEAPISISSAPGGDTFEMVIREVGDVTGKLATMKPGDKIGIRGPMGNGFDAESMKGKDILFIAGGIGIVPMRSLIDTVLANRKDFGEVHILYGCKEPGEQLFKEASDEWDERDDVVHLLTVDKCPEGACWEGNIGLITTLIPNIDFNPENTVAVVIGPPIMYMYVIKELQKKDLPDGNILVSLERRMKCGIGKCGHCQINGVYTCVEGPVFNYEDIKGLPEAFHMGW